MMYDDYTACTPLRAKCFDDHMLINDDFLLYSLTHPPRLCLFCLLCLSKGTPKWTWVANTGVVQMIL